MFTLRTLLTTIQATSVAWIVVMFAVPTIVAAQATTTDGTATSSDAAVTPAAPVQQGIPQASDIYRVTQLDGDQNYGDFVVGPGKFDLQVAPGSAETIEISVTNRTGIEKVFTLTTEDMTGSTDVERPTVLLGNDRGPYTLKDFISVPADRFYIKPGQRVTVPVTVTLPADAEPGGRYGSLLVQTASARNETGGNQPSAAVVSRIAVLFFVTTPGELDRSGQLVDFTTVPDKAYFSEGPITFGILYENTGTVHTNPAGEITITNMFGQEVGHIEVLPWFALPQSLRLREVEWDRTTLLGRYTASARVYRGYGEDIQTSQTTFWVVDWKLLAILTAVVIGLFLLVRYIARNFKLARR